MVERQNDALDNRLGKPSLQEVAKRPINIPEGVDQLLNRPFGTTHKLSTERFQRGIPIYTPEEESAYSKIITWLRQVEDSYLTAREKERFNKYKHPGPHPSESDPNFKRYSKRKQERLDMEWFNKQMVFGWMESENYELVFRRSQGLVRIAPKENLEN